MRKSFGEFRCDAPGCTRSETMTSPNQRGPLHMLTLSKNRDVAHFCSWECLGVFASGQRDQYPNPLDIPMQDYGYLPQPRTMPPAPYNGVKGYERQYHVK